MQIGLTVPEAWVVTTHAFDSVVNSLVPQCETLDDLKQALRTASLPESLVEEIREHCGMGAWAIRSSSIEEDGERSFAGQQGTLLNVVGSDAVADAIKNVWASLYDHNALSYRARLAVDDIPKSMGVVLQRMIVPNISGVLFTRNPVTCDQGEAVLSVAAGLGTTVVQGLQTDTYYLERPSGYLKRIESPGTEDPKKLLTETHLKMFAGMCDQLEAHLQGGVDVEWGSTDGKFMILQIRRITAEALHSRESIWSNVNVGEALPGVASPLTWSILRDFSNRGFRYAFGSIGLDVDTDAEMVGSFYGRIYLNITEFVRVANTIPLLKPGTLVGVGGGAGSELVSDVGRKSSAKFLSRLPTTIPRVIGAQLALPLLAPVWQDYFSAQCQAFFEKDLYRVSQRGLEDELRTIQRLFERTGLVLLSISGNFLLSYVITTEFLKLFGLRGRIGHEKLLQGLNVSSSEPGKALLELGRIARRSMRLRRILSLPTEDLLKELRHNERYPDVQHFLSKLSAFQKEFGHRAPREAELSTPRWREDPQFVFDTMRGFLNAPHLPSPQEEVREAEIARKELDTLISQVLVPGTQNFFRLLLHMTRENASRRESMRAKVVDGLDMYRRFFLECGRRMVQMSVLRHPEDIFYLRMDEIESWVKDASHGRHFRRYVLMRRALSDVFKSLPDPPSTFTLVGDKITSVSDSSINTDGPVQELFGLSASPGRVTGRARVVLKPENVTLLPGEILVVPYADVGWTPLFISAGGVIMELGGPLSHASIVAREFRIPAVVNVHNPRVTQSIKTGDLVTVDGDRGLVILHKQNLNPSYSDAEGKDLDEFQ
jgi:pyruvate,water dikinase